MNEKFFLNCHGLVATHVPDFHLLTCVHVHLHGSEDKEFTIYCDPKFKSYSYATEQEAISSPRYSAVQYHIDGMEESLEGQVVGIISFTPRRGQPCLYLLVNRFAEVNDQDFFKRVLPQHIVQYHKVGQQVTTDVIPISKVIAPLFYVPALDKGVDIGTVGNVRGRNAQFYVITRDKVRCTCLFEYKDYMSKNNTAFSGRREHSQYSYLNFNPYLSIEDMQHIKDIFDVDRNIDIDEDAIEEAYDFLIDTTDDDVMQEMET
jgi:hypothetical protein